MAKKACEGISRRDPKQAHLARNIQGMVGHPSDKDFKTMVRFNMIKGCPVNVRDITNTTRVFGRGIAGTRGKKTRQCSVPITFDYVAVSRHLKDANKDIILGFDVMFINGLAFLSRVPGGSVF